MSSIIEKLKREGALVRYGDNRKGKATFADLSGNGNHGTPSNVQGAGGGIKFDDPNGYIVVADSPTVRIPTALTLVVLANFLKLERPNATQSQLFSKRDAGGREYALILTDAPAVIFYDQNNTHSAAATYVGKKYVAVSAEQGSQPLVYLDGLFETLLLVNTDFSLVSDAPLYIGNWHNTSRAMINPMWADLVINRALTAKEHAALFGELMEGYS